VAVAQNNQVFWLASDAVSLPTFRRIAVPSSSGGSLLGLLELQKKKALPRFKHAYFM
jgi:hypothetical protein